MAKWPEKSIEFARIRAQLLQIFTRTNRPLDLAEIADLFKYTYHYLPNIERRLREMVQNKMLIKHPGRIPTWEKEA